MEERDLHYSNKGGHLDRSVVNKSMQIAERKGLPVCKNLLSICQNVVKKRSAEKGQNRS